MSDKMVNKTDVDSDEQAKDSLEEPTGSNSITMMFQAGILMGFVALFLPWSGQEPGKVMSASMKMFGLRWAAVGYPGIMDLHGLYESVVALLGFTFVSISFVRGKRFSRLGLVPMAISAFLLAVNIEWYSNIGWVGWGAYLFLAALCLLFISAIRYKPDLMPEAAVPVFAPGLRWGLILAIIVASLWRSVYFVSTPSPPEITAEKISENQAVVTMKKSPLAASPIWLFEVITNQLTNPARTERGGYPTQKELCDMVKARDEVLGIKTDCGNKGVDSYGAGRKEKTAIEHTFFFSEIEVNETEADSTSAAQEKSKLCFYSADRGLTWKLGAGVAFFGGLAPLTTASETCRDVRQKLWTETAIGSDANDASLIAQSADLVAPVCERGESLVAQIASFNQAINALPKSYPLNSKVTSQMDGQLSEASACHEKKTGMKLRWKWEAYDKKLAISWTKGDPARADEPPRGAQTEAASALPKGPRGLKAEGNPPRGAQTEAASALPKGPRGLKAEGNNPTLVAIMEKIDLRAFTTAGKGCATYRCSKALEPLKQAVDKDKDIPTLMNFLDDPDEMVRCAGAYVLDRSHSLSRTWGRTHRKQVVDAAARETSEAVGALLGSMLLKLIFVEDFRLIKDKNLAKRLKSMATGHKIASIRASSYVHLMEQDADIYVPFMIEQFGKEKEPTVKRHILHGLIGNAGPHTDTVCTFSASLLDDADIDIAKEASRVILSRANRCKGQYDAFLDAYEKRAQNGKLDSAFVTLPSFGGSFTSLTADGMKDVTKAQRTRFKTISESVVQNNKLNGRTRASALGMLVRKFYIQKPAAQAYARQFINDSDSIVKNRALSLTK